MPKTSAKLEDFEIVQTIGTGSYGTCRKVTRRCDGKVRREHKNNTARGGAIIIFI